MLSIRVSSRASMEGLLRISGSYRFAIHVDGAAQVQRPRNQAFSCKGQSGKRPRTFDGAPGLEVGGSCDTLAACWTDWQGGLA
jgi:hypothetical protein